MRTIRSRRAVSPVIATVILVAVAITVAVAVAYWMGGIAGQYTKFEKIEIQGGSSTKSTEGWTTILILKNTGSATATLTEVYINDVPVRGVLATDPIGVAKAPHEMVTIADCQTDATPGAEVYAATGTNLLNTVTGPLDTVKSGDSKTIEVYIGIDYETLSSGTTVNIKIHSAGGMDYIKLIELE